jgi:hypothetical protein
MADGIHPAGAGDQQTAMRLLPGRNPAAQLGLCLLAIIAWFAMLRYKPRVDFINDNDYHLVPSVYCLQIKVLRKSL